MLATVRGVVASVGTSDAVIEVGGLGLQVSVPHECALSLRIGSEATLYTVLIPREDEWLLFGFSTVADKQIFTLLRGVTGVGPKTALAILSAMSATEIAEAVAAGDDSRFRSVPGIGQKTASLIIVTLTGRMPTTPSTDASDLAEALAGLGWSASLARDTAHDITRANPGESLDVRLRAALATLGGTS